MDPPRRPVLNTGEGVDPYARKVAFGGHDDRGLGKQEIDEMGERVEQGQRGVCVESCIDPFGLYAIPIQSRVVHAPRLS